MTTRRRRTTRPPARSVQVTARDREILFAVGRTGQATSAQICRLHFGDPSTAARRLAKLVAMRLLDVHMPSVNAPNVFTLGAKGVELLEDDDIDMSLVHRSRVGRNLDVHLQMLNDVRVELVLGARKFPEVTITGFHPDLDLRRAAGSTPPAYIPDAIAELELPHGPLALVVEVDTGSEGRSVFAPKATSTVSLWQRGERCWGAPAGTWRPAVFVPTQGRAKALARAIVERGGGALWLVAEMPRVREVGIFGAVFSTADEVASTPRGIPVTYRGALVASTNEAP
jgi:hypothetical protein